VNDRIESAPRLREEQDTTMVESATVEGNGAGFWAALAAEADDLHHMAYSGHFPFVYQRIKHHLGEHDIHFCTELTSQR
jgi:hypothetical protein